MSTILKSNAAFTRSLHSLLVSPMLSLYSAQHVCQDFLLCLATPKAPYCSRLWSGLQGSCVGSFRFTSALLSKHTGSSHPLHSFQVLKHSAYSNMKIFLPPCYPHEIVESKLGLRGEGQIEVVSPMAPFLLTSLHPTSTTNPGHKVPLVIPTTSGIIFLTFSEGPKACRSDSNLELSGFLKFHTGILKSHPLLPHWVTCYHRNLRHRHVDTPAYMSKVNL